MTWRRTRSSSSTTSSTTPRSPRPCTTLVIQVEAVTADVYVVGLRRAARQHDQRRLVLLRLRGGVTSQRIESAPHGAVGTRTLPAGSLRGHGVPAPVLSAESARARVLFPAREPGDHLRRPGPADPAGRASRGSRPGSGRSSCRYTVAAHAGAAARARPAPAAGALGAAWCLGRVALSPRANREMPGRWSAPSREACSSAPSS